jgi:hypothetical protein
MGKYKNKKIYECPKCGKPTSDINGTGLCNGCTNLGFWIDPAGGVHFDDPHSDEFIDPAKMYEQWKSHSLERSYQ